MLRLFPVVYVAHVFLSLRLIPGPRANFAREAREDDFSRPRARKPGRARGAEAAGAKRLGQHNPGTPPRLFSGLVGELVVLLGCELETRRGATNMRFFSR